MTTSGRHEEICDEFLAHAREEFNKGDYLQAAEKAWGAVAHLVNAIAIQRGWKVGTHRRLTENFSRINGADGEPSDRRRLLFGSAQTLHANFYREFMSENEVRAGINDATELVAALKELSRRPGA